MSIVKPEAPFLQAPEKNWLGWGRSQNHVSAPVCQTRCTAQVRRQSFGLGMDREFDQRSTARAGCGAVNTASRKTPQGQFLQQLKDKADANKYRAQGEPIHLMCVEFRQESRSVVGFEVAAIEA